MTFLLVNAILVFPDLIGLKGVNLAFKVYIWTKFRLVKALSLFVTWGPAAFALVPDFFPFCDGKG